MTHEDEPEDLTWDESAAAEIRGKLRRRLAELAAADVAEFNIGTAALVAALTAAAADAAALVEWRHRVERDGIAAGDHGQAEIDDAADTLAAVLKWVAWAIADEIEEIDPERN
jgi:1,6-anhydro-N-acetylmuramate kinase